MKSNIKIINDAFLKYFKLDSPLVDKFIISNIVDDDKVSLSIHHKESNVKTINVIHNLTKEIIGDNVHHVCIDDWVETLLERFFIDYYHKTGQLCIDLVNFLNEYEPILLEFSIDKMVEVALSFNCQGEYKNCLMEYKDKCVIVDLDENTKPDLLSTMANALSFIKFNFPITDLEYELYISNEKLTFKGYDECHYIPVWNAKDGDINTPVNDYLSACLKELLSHIQEKESINDYL